MELTDEEALVLCNLLGRMTTNQIIDISGEDAAVVLTAIHYALSNYLLEET